MKTAILRLETDSTLPAFKTVVCPLLFSALPAAQHDEEFNLLYVAATRATQTLSIEGKYLKNVARQAGVL